MMQNVVCVRWRSMSSGCALFAAACASSADPPETHLGRASQAINFASAQQACSQDPRVELGLVAADVCVGAELFFRDDFGGNGRSCASCHPADNNYTIDPEFIAQLPASDPLFVAEQDPLLEDLERSDLLRQFALILENVDGAEAPTTKFTMRSVPHCLSLATSITAPAGTTTPPLERTGWSGDGAPDQGRLADFQSGAIFQHYTKSLARVAGEDFIPAIPDELAAIDAFLQSVGRDNELDLTQVSLTDAGAEAGRVTFLQPSSRCNFCHSGAGANLASGENQNFDTGVERLRLAALDAQNIPFDGGFGGQGEPTFNFDANGDGTLDAFGNGQFNTPPLVEAADTGPFFHTNAFGTIEEAIAFYNSDAFNLSPAGQAGPAIDLSPAEVANVGRFLRVLNVAFNAQMAIARVQAALPIIVADKNSSRELQQELLRLALVEVEDALEVLDGVSALSPTARADLDRARGLLDAASRHASHTQRRRRAAAALLELESANAALGTGMSFNMGQGTLMF